MFRGVIAKDSVMGNYNSVDFYMHDKVLIENCVKYYHNCWKRRCVVLYSQNVHKTLLKEDGLAIIEEASNDEVLGLRIHVEVHKMNRNDGTIEEMVS